MSCVVTRPVTTPVFSFNLFTNVNWDEEKEKFQRGVLLRRDEKGDEHGCDSSDSTSEFGEMCSIDMDQDSPSSSRSSEYK